MRSKHLLAAALAVAAFAIPVSPSHADPLNSAGCVTTYLDNRQPYMFTGIPGIDFQIKPEPEVHLYPSQPVGVALYVVNNEAGQAIALVNCIR